MTSQKAATRTTTITQVSVNTAQSRLTKANHVILLVHIPADMMIKQLSASTVHGPKTKMFLLADIRLSGILPPLIA